MKTTRPACAGLVACRCRSGAVLLRRRFLFFIVTLALALMVFLTPPSFADLEARLRGRATEDEAAITRRLERAREEMAAAAEFDAVVVNDDVVRAARELVDFIGDLGRPA